VLDELDAPLDESNINVFIVRAATVFGEFQIHHHYHNKRTIGNGRRALWRHDAEHGVSKMSALSSTNPMRTSATTLRPRWTTPTTVRAVEPKRRPINAKKHRSHDGI